MTTSNPTAVEALTEIIFSKLKWFDSLGQQCIDGDSIKDAARAVLDYQALQPLPDAQGTIERLSAVALSMDRLGETQRASDIRAALQALQLHGGGESRSSLPPIALLEAGLFRKRPVVIEARPLPPLFDIDGRMALEDWMDSNSIKGRWSGDGLIISTLEGQMRADAGDWIIRGIHGEFYPCKPDIFAATYEPVQQASMDGSELKPEAHPILQGPTREEVGYLIKDAMRRSGTAVFEPADDLTDEENADQLCGYLNLRELTALPSAILALLNPISPWRPIESAPRDGTEILLLVNGVIHQGQWQGPSDGAIYAGRPSEYNWCSRTVGASLYDGDVAKWMPLPALPGGESGT